LKATTTVLHAIVKKYPMTTFHQDSQRLAVGTNKGTIIVYDLKSASRSNFLEVSIIRSISLFKIVFFLTNIFLFSFQGFTSSVTATALSQDGKHLAAYSLEDGIVHVYQTPWGSLFFAFSSAPSRPFASFPIAKVSSN